ncbi:MAG: GNAT family N-acetyltransferase [Lachnospiraceae bacterium]|nr:GNAT family N-acetyltransferase [Lachnospiraceae bacterium]
MLFRGLETDRLLLKNISAADREFIFSVFSNDDVNRFLFDAEPLKEIKDADDLIDFYTIEELRWHHRWVLVRKNDGVKLGTCGFHCWDKETGCCDVGYDLLPDCWGKGYMLEAMRTIIKFAKDEMNIKQINTCIYINNKKSIRLAEKCGFGFMGQMKDEFFRGKKYPHKIFSLRFD